MQKGSIFSRNDQQYEVLQDGLDFMEKQKSCILPQGERRCIAIEKALKLGLIREIGRAAGATVGETDILLPLSYPDEKEQRDESPYKEVTESSDIYVVPAKPRGVDQAEFFMPVDQLRAQVFLAHGLIYPATYDKAATSSNFDDIQKRAHADLMLFATPCPIKKNQLLLRILLHPDEVADCNRTSDTFLFPMPLPISRLVGIEISPEQGALNRYVDGWVKPDVPVPRHIFSMAQAGPTELSESVLPEVPQERSKQILDVEDSIRKFDRYMGLIAFLRNAGRYFSSITGCYTDYPEAFFALCSAMMRDPEVRPAQNSVADPLLMAMLDQEARLTPPGKDMLSLVTAPDAYIEKDRARSLAMEIYKSAYENEDLGQAFKTLFLGDYRSAIQVLQQSRFPSEAGILAALFKFSSRQSNDHRTIKQRLHEDWATPEQVIPVLGVIGAYYGYTALDAKETSLYSLHPLIKPLVEQHPEIKFHLHTLFERRMIEALYQWAFFRRVPEKSMINLYTKIPAVATPSTAGPRGVLVRDRSYRVHDLIVRHYEVTIIGKIIQHLRDLKGDSVDERSELGRCLLSQCFFLADEFEMSRKSGKDTLRYRISKNRLVDLIADGRISMNPRVIETAIEEDAKKFGT